MKRINSFKKLIVLFISIAMMSSLAVPAFASNDGIAVASVTPPYVGSRVSISSSADSSIYLTAPNPSSNYRVVGKSYYSTNAQSWRFYADSNYADHYQIRLYTNQTIALNVAGDRGALVYDVTRATAGHQAVYFSPRSDGMLGIVLDNYRVGTPYCLWYEDDVTTSVSTSSGTVTGQRISWQPLTQNGTNADQAHWTIGLT